MSDSRNWLVIRRDLRIVEKVELRGDVLTIGRSVKCDITLEHLSVSRYHARLERRGGRWFVVDADSMNGVLVHGEPVKEAPLSPGDIIEIRPFSLNYLTGTTEPGDQSIRLADGASGTATARVSTPPTAVVRQRLDDLYSLARLVLERKDDGSLWQSIQAALQRSLSADRCVLIGLDESAAMYRLAPIASPAGRVETLDASRSVLNEVIGSRQGVLIERVGADQRVAHAASLTGRGVGSVICVPVVVEGQTKAIVYADRSQTRRPFRGEDLEFVAAAVDLAAAAVELDELQEKARELARVHGRIEAAREIQELLLPVPIPQPCWGQVAARNFPAEQMSGDIYDVAVDESGNLIVCLADVVGSGVPAALLTAVLLSTLRLSLARADELREAVRQANAAFESHSPPEAFATMVICRWSASGSVVEVANAGHHPPLWLKPDGTLDVFPERIGLPLGISETWDGRVVGYDASDVALMVLYSDGAIEARNQDGEQYGAARLSQTVARLGARSPAEVVDALAADVRKFCRPCEPADDLTLLVVKRSPLARGE
ncbi:MAG: SpoIIE family protein phosphatase [Phycisphaerae bacterium]